MDQKYSFFIKLFSIVIFFSIIFVGVYFRFFKQTQKATPEVFQQAPQVTGQPICSTSFTLAQANTPTPSTFPTPRTVSCGQPCGLMNVKCETGTRCTSLSLVIADFNICAKEEFISQCSWENPSLCCNPLPTTTLTSTPIPSSTPLATLTSTPVITVVPTVTLTSTPVATLTLRPTITSTPIVTLVPTATLTSQPIATVTPMTTITSTPVVTVTPRPTITSTPVISATPTMVITSTPVNTATPIPAATQVIMSTPTSIPVKSTLACGQVGCDSNSDCSGDKMVCITAQSGNKYCAVSDFASVCASGPTTSRCCAPTQPELPKAGGLFPTVSLALIGVVLLVLGMFF